MIHISIVEDTLYPLSFNIFGILGVGKSQTGGSVNGERLAGVGVGAEGH